MAATTAPLAERVPPVLAGTPAARPNVTVTWRTLLGDGATVIVVALLIPFVMLAIGIPLALGIRLLLEGARFVIDAF